MLRIAHHDVPAVEVGGLQSGEGLGSLLLADKLDEGEAAMAAVELLRQAHLVRVWDRDRVRVRARARARVRPVHEEEGER